jgi:hypothetical protein
MFELSGSRAGLTRRTAGRRSISNNSQSPIETEISDGRKPVVCLCGSELRGIDDAVVSVVPQLNPQTGASVRDMRRVGCRA